MREQQPGGTEAGGHGSRQAAQRAEQKSAEGGAGAEAVGGAHGRAVRASSGRRDMRGRADVRDELCYLYANGRETRPARFDVLRMAD